MLLGLPAVSHAPPHLEMWADPTTLVIVNHIGLSSGRGGVEGLKQPRGGPAGGRPTRYVTEGWIDIPPLTHQQAIRERFAYVTGWHMWAITSLTTTSAQWQAQRLSMSTNSATARACFVKHHPDCMPIICHVTPQLLHHIDLQLPCAQHMPHQLPTMQLQPHIRYI